MSRRTFPSPPLVFACARDPRRGGGRGRHPQRMIHVLAWLLILMAAAAGGGCGEGNDRSSSRISRSPAGTSAYAPATATYDDDTPQRGRNPEYGQMLYANTCTTCHGVRAQGMPHQGVNLRASKFVAAQSDQQLVAFLKVGRKPDDPGSLQKLLMPPRGGNASLDDTSLGDIVAFLRQVQIEAKEDADLTADATNSPATQPAAVVPTGAAISGQ
jgi:cytochrome c5